MNHSIDVVTAPDGIKLHTETWLPDGEPRAVVLVVHGLAEHIGRYAHVAAALTALGCAVTELDHRTHGRSGGAPRAYFQTVSQPVDDLEHFFDRVRLAHPGRKLFVYGHSLGSLIALSLALRRRDQIAGLIISGTPLAVEAAQPALLVRIGALLDRLAPQLPLVALDSKGLSHDPAVVSAYDHDPLVHRGSVRARMGQFIIQVSRQVRAHGGELSLPLLILHGGSDPICPPRGSQMLFDSVSATDKTLKVYPGLYHEIHNEPEKAAVLADITTWLAARL